MTPPTLRHGRPPSAYAPRPGGSGLAPARLAAPRRAMGHGAASGPGLIDWGVSSAVRREESARERLPGRLPALLPGAAPGPASLPVPAHGAGLRGVRPPAGGVPRRGHPLAVRRHPP